MRFGQRLQWVFVGLLALGCDKDEPVKGEAPPPVAETKPGLCAKGGGEAKDKIAGKFFPRDVGSYCVDPNGETRAYGADASGSIDQVCTELFDGECEVYRAFGLERVVTLRYVDGGGSPGAVNVNLSRFATVPGAYGFYTKRIVADADPAESAPAVLDAGGSAGLGTGIAYVWRGKHVVELSYTNEIESPDQIRASSKKILPDLARSIGDSLPGGKALPIAARALPEKFRLAQGISFEPDDALGVRGVGSGAIGYYREGGRRWRVLSVVRDDEAAAADVMKTLRKVEGARLVKEPRPVLRVPIHISDDAPPQQWLIERRGNRIAGVGDEPFAPPAADGGIAMGIPDSERFTLLDTVLSSPKEEEKPKAP